MDPMKTGMIISDARKKLKMTQKDLADKLFVSDKAVSKWERGLCFPDISVLIPLTETLNISLYDLLRGEKVNKEEVEETLKNTINYSNNELKRKKKKYIIISSISIFIVVVISIISILVINNDRQLSAIIDRDTIHNINYYSDYKTTINDENQEKLELIIMKLPLKWKERTFQTKENEIEIDYDASYKEVVKAYNDKVYVNRAMINNSLVIFTTISDVNIIKIRFTDNSYTISKETLLNELSISSFNELLDEDIWKEKVSKKLENDEFINKAFKLFKVKQVSASDLEKNLTPDR